MIKRPSQIKEDLRKAYEAIAEDFSATRSHHWPEFKVFSGAIPSGSKVLDLGCGNARFFRYLAEEKKSVDYTGVDFSLKLLAIAKKNYPKQEFLEQDITALDIPRRFDRIVCVAAFHHIPSRGLRKKALKLMSDHLEDDGLLLISVWNLWQWRYAPVLLKSFLNAIISGFRRDPRDVFIPFGRRKVLRYYHAFIPFELSRLLRGTGFMIERSQVTGHNTLFFCRKNLLAGVGNPLFIGEKKMIESFNKSPAAAACKTSSC